MLKLLKFIFNPDLFTFYFGGGGSAPSNTTSSTTSIPKYAQPYVERMLGKAEATTERPYQAYGGERIEGFSPLQIQAQQEAANLGPTQQLNQGTDLAGAAGLGSLNAGQDYASMATNPYAIQGYMSPYMQNALAPQMTEARRQSDITGLQNASQAVGAGAFGGSRFGIQESERQRGLQGTLSSIYGQGMQKAYEDAQRNQQFGAQLNLQGLGQAGQAAATLGQLGQTQFGQQQAAMQGRAAAGAQQQQLNQQRLQQQYQDFLSQRGYEQQQLGWFSDMLRGLPLTQQTQQVYQAPPSTLSQVGGLGLTAYGLFGGNGPFSGNAAAAAKAKGGKIKQAKKDKEAPAGLADLLLHDIEKG